MEKKKKKLKNSEYCSQRIGCMCKECCGDLSKEYCDQKVGCTCPDCMNAYK